MQHALSFWSWLRPVDVGALIERPRAIDNRPYRLLFLNIHNRQNIPIHLEADIKSREGQTVDAVGFSLVGGPGIMG